MLFGTSREHAKMDAVLHLAANDNSHSRGFLMFYFARYIACQRC